MNLRLAYLDFQYFYICFYRMDLQHRLIIVKLAYPIDFHQFSLSYLRLLREFKRCLGLMELGLEILIKKLDQYRSLPDSLPFL